MTNQSPPSVSQESKKHWTDYVTLTVVVLNVFITLFGGYFLLFRYEAQYLKESKKLAETQNEIQKLQLQVAESKQQLEMQKDYLALADNTLRIQNDLRPIGSLITSSETVPSGDLAKITCLIENKGKYLFHTYLEHFIVTKKPFSSVDELEAENIVYRHPKETDGSDIPPGISLYHPYSFQISPNLMNSFYYFIQYKIETDKNIVNEMKRILVKVGGPDPTTLSWTYYTNSGMNTREN